MTYMDNVELSKKPNLHDINVAVIMDTFTYNSFSPEFNAFVIEPNTWEQVFHENKIDLFFCESAWRGVGKENIIDGKAFENDYKPWAGKIAVKLDQGTGKEKTLFQIIDYCNNNDIPTIFWNKEDPPSFERFIDVALKFDYIFTTDENCIKKYNFMGHDNVFPLLFASQLKMFNPIQKEPRSNKVIFAGSWPSKYHQRCEDMHNIFRKILAAGYELKIYNRNSEKDDPQFFYPEEYSEYVNPKVEHYQIPRVYKEGKIGININTIQESKTMFARRVFELMSSNTFVISNYSEGVNDLFGNNVVFLDKEESLNVNDEEIERICEENLYDILINHNYTARFKYILDTINFDYKEEFDIINVFYLKKNVSIEEILKDFNSIDYYFKKCNIICSKEEKEEYEKYAEYADVDFLTIDQLYELNDVFTDNDYFIIRDLNLDLDNKFIEKAILHYQYIDKNTSIINDNEKYVYKKTIECRNIFFNTFFYKKVLKNLFENKENIFECYTI